MFVRPKDRTAYTIGFFRASTVCRTSSLSGRVYLWFNLITGTWNCNSWTAGNSQALPDPQIIAWQVVSSFKESTVVPYFLASSKVSRIWPYIQPEAFFPMKYSRLVPGIRLTISIRYFVGEPIQLFHTWRRSYKWIAWLYIISLCPYNFTNTQW